MSQLGTANDRASLSSSPTAPTAAPAGPPPSNGEPILCQHCGRTATNGISCEGYCVADSGY